jgi:hypothetical protein
MDVFVVAYKRGTDLKREEVEELKIQLPERDRVLRVLREPLTAELWEKGELLRTPDQDPYWGKEADTVKAAAVILAAINGNKNWDELEEELIKFLFKSHEQAVIKTEGFN